MKLLLIITLAALVTVKANAQDETIAFKNLPQNVKDIVANDLRQYAPTIDERVANWLQNPAYSDDAKHLVFTGRADTYAFYVYCVNGGLTIEAIEKYAKASVDSVGDLIYSTTVLYKCTTHHGAHSTSSVNGEADLRQKYHCTGFSFQAL